MPRFSKILSIIIIVLLVLTALIGHLGTRSGVTSAQVSETLPGDEIFPDPWITIDRAGTMPAAASTTWPWVAQLGADRAGWYAPIWFEDLIDRRLGFVQADVSSARELTAGQSAALESQLSRLAAKKVKLRFTTDPGLVAGVVARVGSTVYDGSVRGQFERLRIKLT